MLSITSAAQQLKLPRDTLLNAVRSGVLKASRDRRGVLRIEEQAVLEFCGARKGTPAQEPSGLIVPLQIMRSDRLHQVLTQQRRLLQVAETRSAGR